MTEYKTKKEQTAFVQADSFFVEYNRFNASGDNKTQLGAFMDGESYVPSYFYPKLSGLYDQGHERTKDFTAVKTTAIHAIMELEANKESGALSQDEYELSVGTHEAFLRKMLLTESAKRMLAPNSSSELEIERQQFVRQNIELYGEMDQPAFDAILATEAARFNRFATSSPAAAEIHDYLAEYFAAHEFEGEEQPLMDEESLAELQRTALDVFHAEVDAVPDTDDSVRYDVGQAVAIMNDSLMGCGLYEKGWRCEEAEDKSIVSTDSTHKRVYLPSSTNRTADELRRLIVHEVGIHAHRGQNGEETGIYPLRVGTADYADVEEGAGVLLECALAGNFDNPSFHRARDRYIVAGLALGTDGGPARDARQTYELAWRLFAARAAGEGELTDGMIDAAKDQAYKHVENAFRGTDYGGPGVIYRKLKVYYEGLRKNAEYFTANASDMSSALRDCLRGKSDHTNPAEAELVGRLTDAA